MGEDDAELQDADDMDRLLRQVSEALRRIQDSEIVRDDPTALAILDRIALAEDMEVVTAELDRLSARVERLAAGRPGAAASPPRPRPARRTLRL